MAAIATAVTKIIFSKPVKRMYWIAWTLDKTTGKFPVVHYGYTEPNQETISGQPNYETFDTELAWKSRLLTLFKIDPVKDIEPVIVPVPIKVVEPVVITK